MNAQPASRLSRPPLGGIGGDWRRRLLRFHVPIALASVLVLALFLTLPRLDPNEYPHADIFSGAFPKERQRGEGGPMEHKGGQSGPMDMEQGGDHDGTPTTEHGRGQGGSMDHQGGDS
jgi:hypothetical protein